MSQGLPCISNNMNNAIEMELILMRIAAAVYADYEIISFVFYPQ